LARTGRTDARQHRAVVYRAVPPAPEGWPSVSVIIPTRDKVELLAACLGVVRQLRYPGACEILFVDNGTTQPPALRLMETQQAAGFIPVEGSFWRPGNGNENTTGLADGNSIDHKAFEEWGAAVRAGFLVSPQMLVFGKAGYVNGEQRRRIEGTTGATLVYDHYRADGYQVGGGVEYTLTQGRAQVYLNAQYVYSSYHGDSSRQRVMGGVGIRFK
jgi:hypothetical protein